MEDQPSVPKHRKTTPSLSDDFVRVLEKAKAHLSQLPFSDEEIYAKLERHEDREDRVDLVVYEILIDYYKMKANLKEDLANDMKNVMHYDKKNRREIVLKEMWKESKTQSMMEDVDVLREIFPEDDPNYLYDKLEQNEDDPNRIDKVTKEILDHKLAEKIDRSIAKEILIKAFLEQFPNPLQTFCNEKEQMNENYKAHALTQLSTDFRNVRKWYIRQVLENHNHHYYGAFKELQRKIKDLPDISEKLLKITRPFGKQTKMPDDRDEFFYHEKFFVDNEQEIKGIKTPSEVFLGGQSNNRLETESKEKRRERKWDEQIHKENPGTSLFNVGDEVLVNNRATNKVFKAQITKISKHRYLYKVRDICHGVESWQGKQYLAPLYRKALEKSKQGKSLVANDYARVIGALTEITKQSASNSQLADSVKRYGLRVHNNIGNGNCMFIALCQQLKLVRGEYNQHQHFRDELANFMRENQYLVNGTNLLDFVHTHSTWEEYCEAISRDGEWGDHVVLVSAANMIGAEIHIHSTVTEQPLVIHPQNRPKTRQVLTLGHISELHYVSLEPDRKIH